ncbi:hypothetical protein SVAN01_02649 [Stagonosporopsis vannaccii]|nr:hypothetical protein SVAN01_02649 [Stagonosporopsis vannaccii]
MSTFYPFPRLPLELRLAIWDMTIEPREVEVRIVTPTHDDPLIPKWSRPYDWGCISDARFNAAMSHVPTSTRAGRKARRKARQIWKEYHPYVHLTSSTLPAILHTCREARNLGLYQQVYLDGEDPPLNDRRYVWLNLDIDLVNIGTWNMLYFQPIASCIKRLKFSREFPEELWQELDGLENFRNAKEVHIVCIDGFENWGDDADRFIWPCAEEGLVFIDETPSLGISETGRVQVGYREMKRLHRKFWRAANSAYDTDYWGTDDGYED